MGKLQIGLAGYGNWTQEALIPALEQDGRTRIVAVSARSQSTREQIKSELGSQITLHSHYSSLLKEELDALIIALPDELHEEALLAVIDSGIPFFYEPPVASHRDRVRLVLRRLLEAEQLTHADMELRFIPVVIQAAERVAGGTIGEPCTAMIRMRGSWSPRDNAGISLTHSLAGWYLDALNHVLGALPKRVLVQDGRGNTGRMQSYAITQLDYGEIWGSFDANISAFQGQGTTIEVCGTEGDLKADLFSGKMRLRTRKQLAPQILEVPAIEPYAGWPGMHECVRAFLDALTGRIPAQAGACVIAKSHLVGLAAEMSIDTGTWAEVERLEDFK